MTNQYEEIKFSRNLWSFSFYFFIVLLIIAVSLFISLLILRLLGSLIGIILSLVCLVIIILYALCSAYINIAGDYYVNSLKNQQFPNDLNSHSQDHDGFIIIHSMGGYASLYSGFHVLIRFFISQKYPFKIYHCYNSEDFSNVLKNEKAKYIWIFGHGWRGGITFKWRRKVLHPLTLNTTSFSYKKIQDEGEKYPKKLFIGQFHCNHIVKKIPDNISLPEILLEQSGNSAYYVTDWIMNHFSIWMAVRMLIKDVKRDNISDIFDKK